MGSSLSTERRQELLEYFKQKLWTPPNLRVDRNLQVLTGCSCSDSLKLHLDRRMDQFPSKAPDIIKALVDKIAGLSPSPELAGLGALAVAIFIDLLTDVSSGDSTRDALREVLAEQKVSEVWDLVDETLKRCAMHLRNKRQLASELQRLEVELSVALTRLKNSVLRDGHISSQALKVWVNGASFHLHMLIHQKRLEGDLNRQQVETLILVYKDDLEKLFRKHEEMIKSKCRRYVQVVDFGCYSYFLVDEASREISIENRISYQEYLQFYYQHQYGRQEEEIQRYFSEIQRDLQQLLGQKGHLSLT